MPRESRNKTADLAGNFEHSSGSVVPIGKLASQKGNKVYSSGTSRSLDELYRAIDGAMTTQGGSAWQLQVLAIHETGGERWVQLSVTGSSTSHDLVVCMSAGAQNQDVIATVEAWLAHPMSASRVIHTS